MKSRLIALTMALVLCISSMSSINVRAEEEATEASMDVIVEEAMEMSTEAPLPEEQGAAPEALPEEQGAEPEALPEEQGAEPETSSEEQGAEPETSSEDEQAKEQELPPSKNEIELLENEAVAKIGETTYATLKEAVEAVQDGETITLLEYVSDIEGITIDQGKKVVIDLNNYKSISFASGQGFILNGGCLELKGYGNVNSDRGCILYGTDQDVADYSVLTVGDGVNLYSPVILRHYTDDPSGAAKGDYGMKLLFEGNLRMGIHLDDDITNTSGHVPEIISKYDTANVMVSHDSSEPGIYAGGYAKWTLHNESVHGGGTNGMEIHGGVFSLHNGVRISTEKEGSPEGEDVDKTGAGIYISQNDNKLPIELNIKWSTIEGYTPLYQTGKEGITLNVTDGYFKNINGGTEAVHSDLTGFISAGYFMEQVDGKYLAEGKKLVRGSYLNGLYQEYYNYSVEDSGDNSVIHEEPKKTTEISDEVQETWSGAAQKLNDTFEVRVNSINKIVGELRDDTEIMNAAKTALKIEDGTEVTLIVEPQVVTKVLGLEKTEDGEKSYVKLDIKLTYNIYAVKTNEVGNENTESVLVKDNHKISDKNFDETISFVIPKGLFGNEEVFYIEHVKADGSIQIIKDVRVTPGEEGEEYDTVEFTNNQGYSTFILRAGTPPEVQPETKPAETPPEVQPETKPAETPDTKPDKQSSKKPVEVIHAEKPVEPALTVVTQPPATGDDANLMLPVMLMVSAAAVICGVVYYTKKNNKEQA